MQNTDENSNATNNQQKLIKCQCGILSKTGLKQPKLGRKLDKNMS